MAKTVDRRKINQDRIASYSEDLYCYRQGDDGVVRFMTELDAAELKDEGFVPYDPTNDELKSWGPVPYFTRRKDGK